LDDRVMRKIIKENPENLGKFLNVCAEWTKNHIRRSFPPVSPSPAGGPPGVDTGALRESIDWTPTAKLERAIHDGVEYGVYQEYGVDANNLPPRPFMAPAMAALKAAVPELAKRFEFINES
jgi:hypothetical protein